VESQLRFEDTGAQSGENSMEMTVVVPYKLQLVQNTPIIYTHPVNDYTETKVVIIVPPKTAWCI
jgi:hypothetical protein